MAKIDITIGNELYEFYRVPTHLAYAITTVLGECEKEETDIVSAVSEVEE